MRGLQVGSEMGDPRGENALRLIVLATLLVAVSCDQYLSFKCSLLDIAETKEVNPACRLNWLSLM